MSVRISVRPVRLRLGAALGEGNKCLQEKHQKKHSTIQHKLRTTYENNYGQHENDIRQMIYKKRARAALSRSDSVSACPSACPAQVPPTHTGFVDFGGSQCVYSLCSIEAYAFVIILQNYYEVSYTKIYRLFQVRSWLL